MKFLFSRRLPTTDPMNIKDNDIESNTDLMTFSNSNN